MIFLLASCLVAAASLQGSPASQMRQNRAIDRLELERMDDINSLRRLIQNGRLVPIVDTDAYMIDVSLGAEHPEQTALYAHARPWVKIFLDQVLAEGHRLYGERFRITSLSRTADYQRRLVRNRGENPTAIRGRKWWQRSSHLAGTTVDITYKGMSTGARRWLEKKLLVLERAGLVEATKERLGSASFHIMVFPEYAETETRP